MTAERVAYVGSVTGFCQATLLQMPCELLEIYSTASNRINGGDDVYIVSGKTGNERLLEMLGQYAVVLANLPPIDGETN